MGDGKTNNTLAVRKAIKAVAQAGSGTVYFPKGEWGCAWASQSACCAGEARRAEADKADGRCAQGGSTVQQ